MEVMYVAIGIILTAVLFVAYHTLYIVSMIEDIYDVTVDQVETYDDVDNDV